MTSDRMRDFHSKVNHVDPDDDQYLECEACHWKGTILDCDRQKVSTNEHPLARRQGYEWTCPKCDTVVWRYWYMLS